MKLTELFTTDEIEEVSRTQPVHLPDQRELIHDLFDGERVWMVFLDGARHDIFAQLVWDYFDGNLSKCWNGGVGYTGDWAARNLQGDFTEYGLFSQLPLRHLDHVDYDGREYFKMAPDYASEHTVHERLSALGYVEGDGVWDLSPTGLNQTVCEDQDKTNGGIVRYLKPHAPFAGLEDLTSGGNIHTITRDALNDGHLSYEQLTEAYIETFKIGLEAAVEFVEAVSGNVIITSDHGTCLTCGQLFHGRHHDKHDHLTHVPWFEVDRVV